MKEENKIREVLYNYEVTVDKDELWLALESHVPQKKKKNRLLIWFALPLVISASLGILFMNQNHLDRQLLKGQDITSTNQNPTLSQNMDLYINPIIQLSMDETYVSKDEPIEPNSQKGNTNDSIGLATDNLYIGKGLYEVKTNEIILDNPPLLHLENSNNDTKIDLNEYALEGELLKPLDAEYLDNEESSNTILRNEIAILERIPSLDNNISNTHQNEDLLVGIKPFQASNSRMWLQLSTGMGYSDLNYTSNAPNSEQVDNLNIYSSALPNISVSALGGIILSNKISVFSGISYDRLVTRLLLQDLSTESFSEDQINRTIIDAFGNITEISGPVKTTVRNNYTARWHTYHHLLSFPLGIEYQLIDRYRFEINAMLGANIKIIDNQEGAYVNENGRLVKFTNANSPYNNALITPFAGVGVKYSLAEKTSIGLMTKVSMQNSQMELTSESLAMNTINITPTITLQKIF